MNRAVLFAVGLGLTVTAGVSHATIAPKNGGPMPQAYRDRIAVDKTAYQMQHAWVQKARRIKAARDAYIADAVERGGPQALAAPLPRQYAVTGTVHVPVFVGYFQSQSAPYAVSELQNKLFDNPSGTVTDYYDEVSYGNITMTGDVYGWTQTANVDTYYSGSSNGLDPANARVGEFIKEMLDAQDGSIDFGEYDNDGPDGVPNSGDDDGYVDVAAFVHNEAGGECTNGASGNIWSHRWVYRAWNISGGQPYTTNDASANGGFIKVDDYVIEPALNCDNSTVIEIGVFCHEFGHAFGLPDLYDTYGNDGNGIGHWGIMGSGNWNTPSSPAHPCAWTRAFLGWITPTEVDWTDSPESIPDIEENPVAYKLPFTDDRFRRSNACVISGGWSLYCGLSAAEGTARNWASPGPGGGYGSNWNETVERDFNYNGSGSVTFAYDYKYDVEAGYDFAYALVEVNGGEAVLATYNGAATSSASIDLTPYLAPLSGSGGPYTLKFRVVSDFSFADDDGYDGSACGALAVDNLSVTGGGENYSTGFETWVDGWHQSPAENPATEYWLVENRRKVGYDANLHAEGLLIMHVDDEVMWAPYLGNSGGDSNVQVRGVFVEEANGDFDLNGAGSNRGENTDVFPGAASVTSFTSATTPNTNDNTGRATRIRVTGISGASASMSATMRAGDPPPTASGVTPTASDNNNPALSIAVAGGAIRHGATFRFTHGAETIDATSLEWVDPVRLVGTINTYGVSSGSWDLEVTNPDGQTVTVTGALTINGVIVATELQSASVEARDGAVELSYELFGREPGEMVRLYRSTDPGSGWIVLVEDMQGDGHGVYRYRDTDVEPGVTYYYRLSTVAGDDERELHRGVATVPAGALRLAQNVPNPFNPTTTIRFYLPDRVPVSLRIYDVSGALVRTLAGGVYGVGPHDVQWNGRDDGGNPVSSGVYLFRLTAGTRAMTKKMLLLK